MMKKIKSYRDLDYEMEIIRMKRKVELDKLRGSFHGLTATTLPSVLTFGLISLFGNLKRRRKKKK